MGGSMRHALRDASRLSIAAVGMLALLALAACSGGESGGGAASTATPITGTFVDSPVNGLHYTSVPSNPADGVTANGGRYQCVPGDTVTFDLGGRVIGTGQPCGELVTVVSVFGATSITDLRVRNLAQLLLTLGGIPAGSQPIDLPATIPATLPTHLDFADTNFEQMLQTALPDMTLVTQDQVAAHLRASFTTLTVSSNGGRITSTPAGLVCMTGTCSYDFVRGTQVTLAAIGTGFTGWNGDGCTGTGTCQILLSTIQAIRAIFVPPPSPPGGGGALTITGAPASVGGTFVAAAALTQVTPPDSQTNIASVAWSEAVTTSPIHSEILAIAFDATNNVPQASAILFSLFHGSAFTVWSCVDFVNTCGITVNGATGTVTFNNSVLSDLLSGAPPITLNGTLTFTPVTGSSTSLSITSASPLAAGTVNQAYSVTLAVSGGTQPFTWSVVLGAWPAGLTLDSSTGAISGTPTTAGTFTFTIQVRDSATPQRSTQKQFSLTIGAGSSGGGGGGQNIPISRAAENQSNPQIVSDGAGGAIIVWQDDRNFPGPTPGIYAQRVNSAGVMQWVANGVPVYTGASSPTLPQVISDGAGGAIIAWLDYRGDGVFTDIFAQRINSAGVVQWAANGVPICTAQSTQENPRLTTDGAGGAIIVWEDRRNLGAYPEVYAQRVSGTGIAQWTVDGVPITTDLGGNWGPRITEDGSGGAIIGWMGDFIVDQSRVRVQKINSAGESQWIANGVAITDFPFRFNDLGTGGLPALVSDGTGGAVITWAGTGDGAGIRAQRINSSGVAQWASNGVVLAAQDPTTPLLDSSLQIISDGGNGAIITWADLRNGANFDIFVQHVTGAGVVQWTTDGVAIGTGIGNQDSPKLIADSAGGAIIVWQDRRKVSEYDIYAQRVNNAGVPQWTVNGLPISTAVFDQMLPVITTDGAGGAFMAWQDERNEPFNEFTTVSLGLDIYAQRVTAAGVLP